VQLIDFNADGKLDAVLGSGELALGNGDGTFSLGTPLFPQPAVPQIPLNYPLLQANLFPDSWPSFVYLNLASGANAVFTPQDSSSANTNVALSVGTHMLSAQYSGDSTYAASVSPAVTINVAPAVTTMAVTSSTNPSYAGQGVTFTATIAGLIPGAGGTVTFSNGSTTLGTAALSNGTASFTTTALSSAGSQTITAAYGGDANDGASSGSVTQKVVAPVTIGPGTGDSTSLTVSSGQSVTTQVSLAGAAGFSGSVKFSCTGLPMNASCSFSPASVTVSGTTAATTMLTVSTAATAMASDGESARALTVLACGLPLLGLLTLLPVARGRRLLLCVGFVLFISVASLTGCGGGSSGNNTAPGSYTFNVIATSGATTSTASYKLTVQ
jgi:Bacterial Ig-like domain (group 3)